MDKETKTTNSKLSTTQSTATGTKARIVQRRVQGKSNIVQRSGDGAFKSNSQGKSFAQKEKKEFLTQVVSMKRVTKVTGGGKKMRMAVFVVIGNKKGKLGFGLAKAADTKVATEKAENKAKKMLFTVNLAGNTLTHEYIGKHGAAKVWMKPAAPGTGIIAGGVIRKVLEVVGVKDVLTKQLGTSNHISNVYATIDALKHLRQ